MPVQRKERKVKTLEPVVVLSDQELDNIITAFSRLINKERETAQTRININANAKKLQIDLMNYRRRLTEWYKIK